MPLRQYFGRTCARGVRAIAILLTLALIAPPLSRMTIQAATAQPSVSIPFEWVNRHIVLKVSVNNSPPLSFVFDTGAKDPIIKLDRARELGLKLRGEVEGAGAGAGTNRGSFVENARLRIVGAPATSVPVRLALPLANLSHGLGQQIDGILGGEFTRAFVVEVDYQLAKITLHDKAAFKYSGPGETVPIRFNGDGHPFLKAEVMPIGSARIAGEFMLDLGSGAALILHSPFVAQHRLPGPQVKTVPPLGMGAGGEVTGAIGRVAELRIGGFKIASPTTLFSQDRAGAFANREQAGNIGSQIAQRFKLFLDYSRNRVILEPTTGLHAPFDSAFSGLAVRAEGPDYRTYRIRRVADGSAGEDAGIRAGDALESIDGKPAASLSLTNILEMFERSTEYKVTVRRGDDVLTMTLTPRRLD